MPAPVKAGRADPAILLARQAVGSSLEIGMICDPGIGVGHIGSHLWKIILRHKLQKAEEGVGNRVVAEEFRGDLAILPGILIGGAHPLGPAPDPEGGLFHDLSWIGIATQMGVERGDEAIVAKGRATSEQIGRPCQMGIK